MEQMIAEQVLQRSRAIRDEFQGAKPFKHACIEDFFKPEITEELLAEFPSFDPKNALNEFGKVGGKAVKTDIRNIGPAYDRLFAYISSPAFLGAMSEMLGIPDLICDPTMYGGGTHENLPGQGLDPHVDFNYDQGRKLHRRVNLLLYLNKEWDVSWGGAIQLHSDPRNWERNQIKTFNCIFNRCVVFETNEYSWHGFRRIKLPADKAGLTRKCISIYLYTRERPKEEIAPLHGTFYVQYPLPEDLKAGKVLTEGDIEELERLLRSRDGWIKFYQEQELKFSGELAARSAYLEELLAALRLPLTGYLKQVKGSVRGAYADGWVASHLGVRLLPEKPVKRLRLFGWTPGSHAKGQKLAALLDGRPAGECSLAPGREFEWRLEPPAKLTREFSLNIDTAGLVKPADGGSDDRDLSFILNEIRAEH